ncbi:MAG: hypothetical protein GXO84_10415 [Chlorobi bacterium]|nr:hypothetical protein [Chlorobiota bacterium]
MFSKGQIIFGILFAITFVIVLIFAYRKDLEIRKRYYKGSFWVLLAFIAFLLLIVGIKSFLG